MNQNRQQRGGRSGNVCGVPGELGGLLNPRDAAAGP